MLRSKAYFVSKWVKVYHTNRFPFVEAHHPMKLSSLPTMNVTSRRNVDHIIAFVGHEPPIKWNEKKHKTSESYKSNKRNDELSMNIEALITFYGAKKIQRNDPQFQHTQHSLHYILYIQCGNHWCLAIECRKTKNNTRSRKSFYCKFFFLSTQHKHI